MEYFKLESKFVPVFHFGLRNHGVSTKLVQLYYLFLLEDSASAVIYHDDADNFNILSLSSN